MKKDERRRLAHGEISGLALGDPKFTQKTAGVAAEGPKSRSWPVDHGNGDLLGDLRPTPPSMELAQVVRAHDPDEMDAPGAPAQEFDRVGREAGANFGLEAGHGEARIAGEGARRGEALGETWQRIVPLQRIAGRHQPPNPIEPQPL
jgi:hypothetical protein